MKLKAIVTPVLAACMAFGVCFTAAACGETAHQHSGGTWDHDENNHWKICAECGERYEESEHHFTNGVCECGQTEEPAAPKTTEYSVSIEGLTAAGGLNILFYNSTNSKLCSISNMKASAELPTGDYVAYITGTLAGYIYTPVKVSAKQPTGIIKAEPATPDENGEVPYQVLYMLSADKIFEGSPTEDIGQICTDESCSNLRFDEFHIASLNRSGELFRLPKGKHQIHMPTGESSAAADLRDYSLAADKYLTQESGGFCSIILDPAE